MQQRWETRLRRCSRIRLDSAYGLPGVVRGCLAEVKGIVFKCREERVRHGFFDGTLLLATAVLARRVGETAQSHTPRFSLHGIPLLGFLEVTTLGNNGAMVLGA